MGRLEGAATRAAARGNQGAERDLRTFAALVAKIPGSVHVEVRPPSRLPVCEAWPAALAGATGRARSPARALALLAPALTWVQNPRYRRRPPGPGFLRRYGYAVLAGPPAGPPALAPARRLAFGVLLLGPRTRYPLHHHPATEVYIPLGPAEWWREAGPWRTEKPGAVIYHPPDVPHATRTGPSPLLALYLWRGDLATHARLSGRR